MKSIKQFNFYTCFVQAFFTTLVFLLVSLSLKAQGRQVVSLDKDWMFLKGEAPGAEKPEFDDSEWRQLGVPHDWSIEGPYDRQNATGRGGGYLPAGIGWYRKTFSLDNSEANKLHTIEFDGVMANSEVWINGVHLGKRPFGYISFVYDLTKHLNFGENKQNVIAVKVDNSVQPASRYYAGAGIYRHVRLKSVNPVHFTHWGTFVTSPEVNSSEASVNIETEVENSSGKDDVYTILVDIVDEAGKVVASARKEQSFPAGDKVKIDQTVEISNPKLWNFEAPNLYKAVTKILNEDKVLDNQSIRFGIRDIRFEAATGFWLNDQNYKLKGVCMHHDAGAVGAAVPRSVWRERLEKLKEVGVNAIRTGHNPMAPEFLDLCDEMGFAVMDETFDTWTSAKNNGEKGYNLHWEEWWERDTHDMVVRDRNHPSIVIYSVGNEIRDNLNSDEGFKKYEDQENLVHSLDPTRPVTMALFRPGSSKVYTNGLAEKMDVVGQNYRPNELVAAHEANPHWKVIGTENGHDLRTWLTLRDNDYMAGQFLWTGFDYLGEADWPETTFNKGLFDRVGNWKQQALQRQSWWVDEPVVNLVRKSKNAGNGDWVADWTPADFDTYDIAKVEVYSNCDEVELFLNNRSLGTLTKPENDAPREWDVNFEEGTIKAVGKNNGKEVALREFTSAGAPAKIAISSSKTSISDDWEDVRMVTAEIRDENGIRNPNSDQLVKFSVSGPGEIIAVDNGNILSHDSYQDPQRYTHQGKVVAYIRAKKGDGDVVVKAEADGLTADQISLKKAP